MAEFVVDFYSEHDGVRCEQVVRCRDCKHFTPNKEFWVEPPKVPFPMIGATSDCCDFWAGTECKVKPDGFCAWGERMEDA